MLKPPSFLARAAPPLAAFKLVLGLAAFAATWREGVGSNPDFPYSFYGLFAAAFGVTGALLLLGGREDRRAVALGGFFLVTSTSWSNGPLHLFGESHPGAWPFALADALEVHAFMPYFLWAFARDFPSPLSSLTRRRLQTVVAVSAAAGIALFLARLPPFADHLQFLGGLLFNLVILPLTIAAFPFMLWRSRFARKEEQEKVRLFLRRLCLLFGPMLVFLLLTLFVPPFERFLDSHPPLRRYMVVFSMLPALALPLLVPYAAIVHRVFQVKMVARRALQYTLARWLAITLIAVPLASLAIYLYANRNHSLLELFSGSRVLLLLAVAAVGVAALRYRRMLLDTVDRRFFREQYDARQILTLLVERIRTIRDSPTLAALICREIDLAFHLEEIGMLVLDPRSGMLVDPRSRARKLDASCALALTISNASEPLEADLADPHSALLRLPEKERHWLVDSGFRLIVPVLARDGSLLGLIGLGPKRSGLAFLREDRRLLHTIACTTAWVLELEQQKKVEDDSTPPVPPQPAAEHAKECPHCGTLHPSYTVLCSACSKRLERSRVPYVLPGKFRIEKRIGVGGMGIVYAGCDLSLGRRVAIKTLRRVSPEDAMRLRHEARTAAAVSHSHLAAVFGLETWRGTPMLVMELLEGGTLADRVEGRLAPRETVDLGIDMADALAQLHSAEILHRDIKPSNIGYTRDGVPKLMDFGIAGVIFELRQEEEDLAAALDMEDKETDDASMLIPPVAVWETGSGSDVRHRFAGTLSYLSPEAVRGRPADASFDLWSLCVVLYECLLGRKLFTGEPRQVAERIRSGRIPDFSLVCPEHSPALAGFFRDALHPSPYRRPATAQELRSRLAELRKEI